MFSFSSFSLSAVHIRRLIRRPHPHFTESRPALTLLMYVRCYSIETRWRVVQE